MNSQKNLSQQNQIHKHAYSILHRYNHHWIYSSSTGLTTPTYVQYTTTSTYYYCLLNVTATNSLFPWLHWSHLPASDSRLTLPLARHSALPTCRAPPPCHWLPAWRDSPQRMCQMPEYREWKVWYCARPLTVWYTFYISHYGLGPRQWRRSDMSCERQCNNASRSLLAIQDGELVNSHWLRLGRWLLSALSSGTRQLPVSISASVLRSNACCCGRTICHFKIII